MARHYLTDADRDTLDQMIRWWREDAKTPAPIPRKQRMPVMRLRQGRLDAQLTSTGPQAISIYVSTSETGDQKYLGRTTSLSTENWDNCYPPVVLGTTDTIATGTKVGVLEIQGVRMIWWAGCQSS